jgi:hypothetical protein
MVLDSLNQLMEFGMLIRLVLQSNRFLRFFLTSVIFQIGQQRFLLREKSTRDSATKAGFHFVDTFNMTISRYKHFLYGQCACHYHLV